jgi:hypothetical protein
VRAKGLREVGAFVRATLTPALSQRERESNADVGSTAGRRTLAWSMIGPENDKPGCGF